MHIVQAVNRGPALLGRLAIQSSIFIRMTTNDPSWLRGRLPPEAREALESGLPASEVWSLLLGVMEARASRRTPASLREQWGRDRFVEPCYLDQRTLIAMDSALLAAVPAFESIELSPVAPLGVCSAMALASQNKVVSTTRGTEVVSDPTNVLALECARRLREDGSRVVRLVTSHRCVRAQPFPKLPGYAAHFRMLCLASAGHERENRALLSGELTEHICAHLAALDALERVGYSFSHRKLRLMASPANAELAERIAAAVVERVRPAKAVGDEAVAVRSAAGGDDGSESVAASARLGGDVASEGVAASAGMVGDVASEGVAASAGTGGNVASEGVAASAGMGGNAAAGDVAADIVPPLLIEHQPLQQAYYDGLRFQIDVTAPNGVTLPLIDGGTFDWLRKLLSNGKMVFVASAMGSQVAAYLFRRDTRR